MGMFNPDFWEISVQRSQMEAFANEDALWRKFEPTEDASRSRDRNRETLQQVLELIRTELTARQRQVIQLYYLVGITENEVAQRLMIPQQVVSQHLHGILRNGNRVGGAVPKLRKLCKKRGITW